LLPHVLSVNFVVLPGVVFFAAIVAVLPEPDASRLIIDDGLGEAQAPKPYVQDEGQPIGRTIDAAVTPRRSARLRSAVAAAPVPSADSM